MQLSDRIGSDAEQPGDLDRCVEAQGELVRRRDLPAQVDDPGRPWSIYGYGLRRRWQRDPAGHAPDLGAAVTALEECLRLTPDGDAEHTGRLVDSANAHLLGHLNGVQRAALDTAVERATQVLRSADPGAERLMIAIRQRASRTLRAADRARGGARGGQRRPGQD